MFMFSNFHCLDVGFELYNNINMSVYTNAVLCFFGPISSAPAMWKNSEGTKTKWANIYEKHKTIGHKRITIYYTNTWDKQNMLTRTKQAISLLAVGTSVSFYFVSFRKRTISMGFSCRSCHEHISFFSVLLLQNKKILNEMGFTSFQTNNYYVLA